VLLIVLKPNTCTKENIEHHALSIEQKEHTPVKIKDGSRLDIPTKPIHNAFISTQKLIKQWLYSCNNKKNQTKH